MLVRGCFQIFSRQILLSWYQPLPQTRFLQAFSRKCLYFSGMWKTDCLFFFFFLLMSTILSSIHIPVLMFLHSYLFIFLATFLKAKLLSSRVFIRYHWSHAPCCPSKGLNQSLLPPMVYKVLCPGGTSQECLIPKSHLTILSFSQRSK